MALGKLERDEVVKHVLEAERILKSARQDRFSQKDIHEIFDNILNAIKRIAGSMD